MNKLTLYKFIKEINSIINSVGYDTLFISTDVGVHGAHLRQVCNNEVIEQLGKRGKFNTYRLPRAFKPKIDELLGESPS